MRNRIFVILELILLTTAFTFAILWIAYPEKNYEPFTIIPGLFSGLLEIIRRFPLKKKNISEITVNEIIESINTSAPLMRKEMEKKYNGIRVKWTGYLRTAENNGIGKVRVNMNVEKDSIIGNSIWFTGNIKRIPEIKTLPKESKIIVLGDIISASGAGISVTLKPIDIEIIR